MRLKQSSLITAVPLLVAALGTSSWAASTGGLSNSNAARSTSASDIQNAKPFSNPLPGPDTTSVKAERAVLLGPPGVSRGKAGAETRAFGSFGIPYTSTRVQHGNTFFGTAGRNFLHTTYPYRAAGRLTFTVGTGTSLCSASLVRRSVLVTAAHCVLRFGGAAYSGWRYTPGAYAPTGATATEQAPHGTWNWARVQWPGSYANGTDTGSGSARNNDVAVIILHKNAQNQFIGNITGWFAYGWNNYSFVTSPKTGNQHTAAVTTLGYPALFDSGRIMQRADGPTYTTTVSSALQLWQGNNFTGGSSGGPWLVNFGAVGPVFSGGANAGTAPVMAVVGVTSWGSADPNTPKDNYSSRFGQNAQFPASSYGIYGAGNIGALINGACSTTFPGSTQTFAQLGYC